MLCVTLLLAGVLGAAQASPCPAAWTALPQSGAMSGDPVSCFRLFTEKKNWHSAKASCISLGGSLARITSPRKSNELRRNRVLPATEELVWIGGNDLATKGRWVWSMNGLRIYPFVDWDRGHPSKIGQCIGVDGSSLKWKSLPCEATETSFLCERVQEATDPGSGITTTSTLPPPPTLAPIWHDEISFDGAGYLEVDKKIISYKKNMRLEITMAFSTFQPEGLLLWQGEPGEQRFMALAVKQSNVHLVIDGKTLKVNGAVDDGLRHEVKVKRHKADFTLSVDGRETSREVRDWDPGRLSDKDLFLGGLPPDPPYGGVSAYTHGLFGSNFAGCVHHFEVHNYFVLSDGEKSLDENSFGGRVNFNNHHLHRKSARVASSDKCIPPSRPPSPPPPPLPLPALTSRPPLLNLTTIATTTTRRLETTTLPAPTRPVYVKRDVPFDGDSFYEVKDSLLNLDRLVEEGSGPDAISVSFELKSHEPNGLLLWYGERYEDLFGDYGGMYLGIIVEDGVVKVVWNFGSGESEFTSFDDDGGGNVGDGVAHRVELVLGKFAPSLRVDGNEYDGPPFQDNLFPKENLYIGGVPETLRKGLDVMYRGGLYGCVTSMEIKEFTSGAVVNVRRISFDDDVVSVRKSLKSCSELVAATPAKSSTTTTKRPATRPPYRTTKLTTTMETRPPVVVTTPRPRPIICREKEVSLAGSGYLRLKPKFIGKVEAKTKLEITLTFSTVKPSGLLLWQGSVQVGNDWIAIGVNEGMVEFWFSSGAGSVDDGSIFIRSEVPVTDGKEYRVVALKTELGGYLSVEAGADRKTLLVDKLQRRGFSVGSSDLYIGGHPDDVKAVTGGRFRNAFDGCITFLQIFKKDDSKTYGSQIPFNRDGLVLERSGLACQRSCSASRRRRRDAATPWWRPGSFYGGR